MKYQIRLLLVSLIIYASCSMGNAQVGINADNSNPDSSAMLDISSTDKGLLIPRLTSTERLAINNPAEGLMVYDSTTLTFWYYDNNLWNEIRNGSKQLSGTDFLELTPNFNCSEIIGSAQLGLFPISVAVSGNSAYIVDEQSNELRIVDVSNPSSPNGVGSLGLGAIPISIAVSGNFAYVVDTGTDDLKVIDVSNSSNPIEVSSTFTGPFPVGVAVSGNFAYVVDDIGDDLKVIDVSNPNSPNVVSNLAIGPNPVSVAVSGNFAYVVDEGSDELIIIDVSTPAAPSEAGRLAVGPSPKAVAVSGNFAYVVDEESDDLKVIDISNPNSPNAVSNLAIGPNPESVVVSGNFIYVVDSNSGDLKIIDVSKPNNPALIGSVAIGPLPQSLAVSGDFAYVVDGLSDDLKVIELKACPALVRENSISGALSTVTGDSLGKTLLTGLDLQGNGDILNLQASSQNAASFSQWYNADQSVRGIIGADGTAFSGTPNQFSIATWTNHPIRFFTDQNSRMVIDTDGEVGIGTPTPNSTLEVNGTITATSFAGDGSGITNVPGRIDNLGNHTATQSLDLANNNIINGGNIMANSFMGDGSALTNLPSDNLGNHIATTNIQLSGNWLSGDGDNEGIWISNTGNVGIGTNNPTRGKLEVSGVGNPINASYGYLNALGQTGTTSVSNFGYCIYTSGRIASAEFNAFSDARIKNILGPSDSQKDLTTLMGVQITDYQHIDTVQKGSELHKKVIAQQLATVFPQAVNNNTREVIPDIYQRATLEDDWIQLTTNLQVGERVKIITETSNNIHEVIAVEPNRFQVDFKSTIHLPFTLPERQAGVFVYGREVDDFHTVDYEAIAMLNISATQEQQRVFGALLKSIEVLEAENTRLKSLANKLTEIEALLQSQSTASNSNQ